MTVFPVLIDSRPAYLAGTDLSLLHMPLGTGTVLQHLWQCCRPGVSHEPSVLTTFSPSASYEESTRSVLPGLRGVFAASQFGELLNSYEPADWILFVNSAQFPAAGFHLRKWMRAVDAPRTVAHIVTACRSANAAQERVLLDKAGCVRRIQRYYDGITRFSVNAVFCTLAPVTIVQVAAERPFKSLADLRHVLARHDMPARDVCLSSDVFDLTRAGGYLQFSEQVLADEVRRCGSSPSPVRPVPGVLLGRDCKVHPTARLYAPLILQDGAVVDAHSTIIGPALLGADCRVKAHAVVAQTLVTPGVVVPAKTTVRHCILTERGPTNAQWTLMGAPYGDGAARGRAGPCTNGKSRHVSWQRLRRQYPTVKRVVDTVLAAAGLVVLAPLFLLVAALIKVTSRGPVLFAHPREGKDGREFRCWKFRTMVQNAHAQQRALYKQNLVDGPQFKLDHDPRITLIGRWLRVTNIDELPQLINVVRGDMSLIGPRPSPFRENQICVPWRKARLSVRPGITGLWQLCRSDRSGGDFHQWIYYDMLYVRCMSPLLDLKIVLATFLSLAGRWSVPLHYLIPASQLENSEHYGVPTRAPILEDPTQPAPTRGVTALSS